MYPQMDGVHGRGGWGRRRGGADWTQGYSSWTTDYPRSDRHFSEAMRRLTRVHGRSVEQSVNLDDGNEVFYWPWLYAVEVGHWNLTDTQAKESFGNTWTAVDSSCATISMALKSGRCSRPA